MPELPSVPFKIQSPPMEAGAALCLRVAGTEFPATWRVAHQEDRQEDTQPTRNTRSPNGREGPWGKLLSCLRPPALLQGERAARRDEPFVLKSLPSATLRIKSQVRALGPT